MENKYSNLNNQLKNSEYIVSEKDKKIIDDKEDIICKENEIKKLEVQ